jgi:hypothetical protein
MNLLQIEKLLFYKYRSFSISFSDLTVCVQHYYFFSFIPLQRLMMWRTEWWGGGHGGLVSVAASLRKGVVALQSLKDLGRLTYRRFLELFRHMVRLLGRVINPSQGLYLHRTTQHRQGTNIHALSGIQTHNPSNQPAKTHASDRMVTVTGSGFHAII